MKNDLSDRILRICTVSLLLPVLLLASCTGNRMKEKIARPPGAEIPAPDSTYLFNGKDLEGWEISDFGPQGPVYVSGGEIILGMGEGCTGITWKKEFPEMDYMVTLEAMRVQGNDFFCGMTFPVGKRPCTLIVGGWGGAVTGLSCIDNMDASENETTRLMKFESERWYKICLIVRNDSIKALIDDQVIVDFRIGDKLLSVRSEVELSKPFGITSWYTTAALRNIRLQPATLSKAYIPHHQDSNQ